MTAEHSFRPLSSMIESWTESSRRDSARWSDAGLVNDGLSMFAELLDTANDNVLLATDLHAGNVLSAEREPWLVIDPKPFVGDRCYDLTQHLLNCRARLGSRPRETVDSLAGLAKVDADRVMKWTFARLAAEPRDDWNDEQMALARVLARNI